MKKMTNTLKEMFFPFVVQVALITGFFAGWGYLWIA
jgi:hypothetical protein